MIVKNKKNKPMKVNKKFNQEKILLMNIKNLNELNPMQLAYLYFCVADFKDKELIAKAGFNNSGYNFFELLLKINEENFNLS